MVVLGLLQLDGRPNCKLLPSQRISTISLPLREIAVATWVVRPIACSCVSFAALRIMGFAATPLSWSAVAEQPINLNLNLKIHARECLSSKSVSVSLIVRVCVCVCLSVSQSVSPSTRSRKTKETPTSQLVSCCERCLLL